MDENIKQEEEDFAAEDEEEEEDQVIGIHGDEDEDDGENEGEEKKKISKMMFHNKKQRVNLNKPPRYFNFPHFEEVVEKVRRIFIERASELPPNIKIIMKKLTVKKAVLQALQPEPQR